MNKLIKVVVINSISYTGTTWINAVLGCHKRAFAVGPPDNRVWNKRFENWDNACRLHGDKCSFWPAFHKKYDPDKNFYIQLADASGKDFIIINNPATLGAAIDLEHKDIELKRINVIRDGRAILASHMRKYPENSVIESISEFLNPAFREFPYDPDNTEVLSIRYEDMKENQLKYLQKIGDFV